MCVTCAKLLFTVGSPQDNLNYVIKSLMIILSYKYKSNGKAIKKFTVKELNRESFAFTTHSIKYIFRKMKQQRVLKFYTLSKPDNDNSLKCKITRCGNIDSS